MIFDYIQSVSTGSVIAKMKSSRFNFLKDVKWFVHDLRLPRIEEDEEEKATFLHCFEYLNVYILQSHPFFPR